MQSPSGVYADILNACHAAHTGISGHLAYCPTVTVLAGTPTVIGTHQGHESQPYPDHATVSSYLII